VSEFAPPSLQKSFSYTAGKPACWSSWTLTYRPTRTDYVPGWLSALAWCCGTTSGFFLAGSLIQGVIVELHPDYVAEPWRAYLLVVVLATIGAVVNTYLSRKLPKLEGFAFLLTIAGFISVIIILWVLSSEQRLTASEVFQTFSNDGGWSSLGLSMVAGQILLVWTLTGEYGMLYIAVKRSLISLRSGRHRTHGGRDQARIRRHPEGHDSQLLHKWHHGLRDAHHLLLLPHRPYRRIRFGHRVPVHPSLRDRYWIRSGSGGYNVSPSCSDRFQRHELHGSLFAAGICLRERPRSSVSYLDCQGKKHQRAMLQCCAAEP